MNKGLTVSIIFEASSLNYGEGLGNVTSLKKLTRGDGESYSYISRQALRYNIVNQMGCDNTELALDGSVIQFAPSAKIDKYPEIDLFGYMKTSKTKTATRSAVVRLSNGISVESFSGDLDFLTNKGLFDRYLIQTKGDKIKEDKKGGNIAQSEIHTSYYAYTITIDLEKIGIDTNDEFEPISSDEKARRVNLLLSTIKFLYRDIKGRREDLKPLFIIGGIYSIKNPFFESKLKVKNNKLQIETIEDIINLDKEISDNTTAGLIRGIFDNEDEIKEKLNATDMKEFFQNLSDNVIQYYKN